MAESKFSDRHMVSAGHHLAADAARDILDAGGNAADAGVCGGICLAVLLSEYIHTVVEAMKLGFADRHAYYGDPRFIEVPLQTLLNPAYAKVRAPEIDSEKACSGMPAAGLPAGYDSDNKFSAPVADDEYHPLERDTSFVCAEYLNFSSF